MTRSEKWSDNGKNRLPAFIVRAFTSLGWRSPKTINEMTELEEWASKQTVPEHLLSRDFLFKSREGIRESASPFLQAPDEAEINLARAAREGTDIPPEIQEVMQRDREKSEQKGND